MKGLSPSARRAMLWVITTGLLLIVAGTLLPVATSMRCGDAFRYVYATGAVLTLIGRLLTPYTGDNLRVKRLYRIETWSAVFFCAAAFFLFYEPRVLRDWLAFTLAGGCIQAYASFMIPRIIRKNGR